jgi:2,3-dihydroxyphenylpropionate 1,2-dioxygenase
VLLIASGGLSHWLPSNDPRDASVPADRRAAMIHGRQDVRAFSAIREPPARALAGNPAASNARLQPEREIAFTATP